MRIALCLRGKALDDPYINWTNKKTLADYRLGLPKMKELMINKYGMDVFIHGWVKDLSKKNQLQNDFTPKKMIVENQRTFQDEVSKISNYREIISDYVKHINPGVSQHELNQITPTTLNFIPIRFSYSYSFNRVLELKSQYEKENNFKYDLVIVSRFDILLKEVPNFYTLDTKHLYFLDKTPLKYGDDMICGSSSAMDTFKKLYIDVVPFFKSYNPEKDKNRNRNSIHYHLANFLDRHGWTNEKLHVLDVKYVLYKYLPEQIVHKFLKTL